MKTKKYMWGVKTKIECASIRNSNKLTAKISNYLRKYRMMPMR